MLAGTLATVTDAIWFQKKIDNRLNQLIQAFLNRSNTTIRIEGPNRTERLEHFTHAYTQLSLKVLELLHAPATEEHNPNILLFEKALASSHQTFLEQSDRLGLLIQSYILLRVVEELGQHWSWLNQYDVTLANAVIHSLLEPMGVHQLDLQAQKIFKGILASQPLKPISASSSPCFGESWGIRWCVAIGV